MGTDRGKKKLDDEPYEEFIDDHQTMNDGEKAYTGPSKYEEWTIKELREEAEKYGIANCMQMNKKELIKALTNYSQRSRH